jgi:hypothetical protein
MIIDIIFELPDTGCSRSRPGSGAEAPGDTRGRGDAGLAGAAGGRGGGAAFVNLFRRT